MLISTGHVVSREDLAFVAELCIRHNVYVISDEGGQFVRYDKSHQRRTWPCNAIGNCADDMRSARNAAIDLQLHQCARAHL